MDKEKQDMIITFYEVLDNNNHFEAGYAIDKNALEEHINIAKEIENEGYIKLEKYKSTNTNGFICTIIFQGQITDKGLTLVKELNIKKNKY
ncbi:hypothetical protein AL713_15950 [Clostridium botulinum]|uniref:hypothetical protein n=1 Tax=Clostridium botulinum TaxID=1491 RepID=UPI00099B3F49|nr:hypothetical protein [Clostridium botulinum]OPD29594.1 hypothetical protein AL713_15950 [Clostridium botulinum]HCL4559287.1 hypothetical protein [Clostridium botulinum]HCL4570059.1 hypothetical protein [Clostridium botulinum]HCL4584875.1 hypothetical protein [Clostridium botulinum]